MLGGWGVCVFQLTSIYLFHLVHVFACAHVYCARLFVPFE